MDKFGCVGVVVMLIKFVHILTCSQIIWDNPENAAVM